ncbi:MAG TPA: apolipoprotein N-acyltransferase [Terriglobia bacterium]|nr:apolipoprotein N-acyltransferase [Terriglobia bacterium]
MKRGIIPLGALTGALLVLSLPKPDLYPLAWIALVPLMTVIASTASMTGVVLSSYIGGVVFFAGSCYWITETMNIYGGLSMPVAVGVGALFALVFGLYFLLFGLGLRLAVKRFGLRGLFFAAPLWVTVELLRSVLFSGFPWMLSGYALVPYAGILQIATWTGVYGLSFLATAVNSAIAYGISQRSTRWIAAALAAVLAAVLLPVFGARTVNDPLAVRLVQTNISIDQSWKKPDSDALMNEVSALSVQDGIKPPRLVVWPETPAPFYLTEDAEFRTRMQNIARKVGAYFLVGYIDAVGEGPANSAGLLNPMGEQISRYDKMHLVPFGEYVPFKQLLFFAESLTRQVGEFVPGTDYTLSTVDGHKISTIICYESIFPNLVRQSVKRGSNLIVLITNDGWFGQSSAPYQHLRMGVVRAVENRRYMVRTANTGVSAIIDPYGRIEARTPVGVRTILDGLAHFRSDRTFYTEYGDVFAYANVLLVILFLILVIRGQTSKSPKLRSQKI